MQQHYHQMNPREPQGQAHVGEGGGGGGKRDQSERRQRRRHARVNSIMSLSYIMTCCVLLLLVSLLRITTATASGSFGSFTSWTGRVLADDDIDTQEQQEPQPQPISTKTNLLRKGRAVAVEASSAPAPAPASGHHRQQQRRDLQSLGSTWEWDIAARDGFPVITLGGYDANNGTDAGDGGGSTTERSRGEIQLQYEFAGSADMDPATKQLFVTIYENDCVTLADPNAFRIYAEYINVTETNRTTTPETTVTKTVLNVEIDVLEEYISYSTKHYTELDIFTALIQLCVKADYSYIYPPKAESQPQEPVYEDWMTHISTLPLDVETESMNFHETNITITLDLVADFQLAAISVGQVTPDAALAKANIGCNITAYFCDDEGTELVNVTKYKQGSTLQFCVTHHPDDPRNLRIKDIIETNLDSFGNLTEHADIVTNYKPDFLTSKSCVDGLCNVKTFLASQWFALLGSYNLTVTGTAVCSFGRGGKRLPIDIKNWNGDLEEEYFANDTATNTLENTARKMRMANTEENSSGEHLLPGFSGSLIMDENHRVLPSSSSLRGDAVQSHGERQYRRLQEDGYDDAFAWEIEPINEYYPKVLFSNETSDGEVMFKYYYTGRLDEERSISVELFQYDCITPANRSALVARHLQAANGIVTYDVDVILTTITDTPEHYTAINQTNAEIKFCARVDYNFVTRTVETGNEKQYTSMNFHETKVTVNVDLVKGFQLDAITTDMEGDQSDVDAKVYCPVIAYHCDQQNEKLVPAPTFVPGDQLQVCVEHDPADKTPLHVMEIIDMNLYSTSEYDEIITDFLPDDLTVKTCKYGVCNIKHQLTSKWFPRTLPQYPRVEVRGRALCRFGHAPIKPATEVRRTRSLHQQMLSSMQTSRLKHNDNPASSVVVNNIYPGYHPYRRQLQASVGLDGGFDLSTEITVEEEDLEDAEAAKRRTIALWILILIAVLICCCCIFCCCCGGGLHVMRRRRRQGDEEVQKMMIKNRWLIRMGHHMQAARSRGADLRDEKISELASLNSVGVPVREMDTANNTKSRSETTRLVGSARDVSEDTGAAHQNIKLPIRTLSFATDEERKKHEELVAIEDSAKKNAAAIAWFKHQFRNENKPSSRSLSTRSLSSRSLNVSSRSMKYGNVPSPPPSPSPPRQTKVIASTKENSLNQPQHQDQPQARQFQMPTLEGGNALQFQIPGSSPSDTDMRNGMVKSNSTKSLRSSSSSCAPKNKASSLSAPRVENRRNYLRKASSSVSLSSNSPKKCTLPRADARRQGRLTKANSLRSLHSLPAYSSSPSQSPTGGETTQITNDRRLELIKSHSAKSLYAPPKNPAADARTDDDCRTNDTCSVSTRSISSTPPVTSHNRSSNATKLPAGGAGIRNVSPHPLRINIAKTSGCGNDDDLSTSGTKSLPPIC